jgi:hypothetical protein
MEGGDSDNNSSFANQNLNSSGIENDDQDMLEMSPNGCGGENSYFSNEQLYSQQQ